MVVLLYKFSVYIQILERNVFCSFYLITAFFHIVKAGVFHTYVINVFIIVESDDEDTELTLFAGYIFEVYVAYGRSIATVTLFTVFVLQIDAEYGFATLADSDVTHKYIFYQSASASTGLDADYAIQIRAVHAAVLYEQVTVTTGYFAADDYTAMTVFHETAAYYDILAGDVPFAAVLVTSGFNGYTVVTRIESTVLYQHVFARFRVAAVSVGTTVENVYTTYDEAFAKQRVDNPERRVQQGYIFY